MATGVLYFNGQDVESTFGLIVVSTSGGAAGSGKRSAARAAGGLLGGPARTLPLLDMPQMPGSLDPGIALGEDTRGIVITGMVRASDFTTVKVTLDLIKEVCGTGLVEIRSAYDAASAYYGVLETPDIQAFTPTLLNGWATVVLAFTCPNPYAWALSPSIIGIGASNVDIPLGTAPSSGRDQWSALIEIVGAATTPTLTYSNFRGDTVSTMAFTYSPLAGDSIVIDCGRRIVNRFVSGVRSNAMSFLTAGYAFPALDPGDAYVAGSLWPKLSLNSGVATITYYRAWR